ncbi:XRE family transcriptional regulator [Streptomyces sp. GbtcB6]|uniref:XRE family transcriptional regulator n=1 Tax=Streptomyces sp. GbtcB6 TaxID=2824751 RepID=UPI001C2F99ED|nr:XRE family transcriptional regulator [Streptomyces sp. GbtcB6]
MPHSEGARTPPPDESPAARLRELKERTGLSLAALAARTPYSKSAWHRYLSGDKRPPRPAVEALARLAGADPAAVLALCEVPEEPPVTEVVQERRPARRWWRLPLSALALLAVAGVTAAAVTVSDRRGAQGTQPVSGAPRCHGRSCQGELPVASDCARDAQTKSTVTDPAYDVRLRWSPACGTAWSEVRLHTPRAREVSVRAGQDVLSASYPAEDSVGYTSPMLAVPAPRGVEACAEVAGRLACTGLEAEPAGEQ